MPDTPDVLVAIYDVPGKAFGRDARTGKNLIHYGVVVKVRGLTYAGRDLAVSIAAAMDENFPLTTTLPDADGGGEYTIQNIRRGSEVVSLGEEVGTKRELWSIDARMPFAQSTPTIG